ncbi:hypothetical protein GGH12_005323 [Coemansia sp. RSA 1822]|nr:hypothetical protein LPJ76_004963 [Coemansia sp. RSA 638]KAJ2120402.1 hypothetical protein IW147_005115 [Coemansia sp. RSA 720]KAJ2539918.1 hypothetical protein GGF49_004856 [Coemansia sp. RSA 1853]KAJ2559601.1 hypothetical protein GGH12_005323 [Coemansia sp. RSA 1822]
MNTDHFAQYSQGPPMQWQSTEPSHHAHPSAMHPSSELGARYLPPITAPQPAQPHTNKKTKHHHSNSGGSERACSSDEASRILDERRRRNASASARFRKRRNERERELVVRCMYLENQLLQAVGAVAFESVMKKAPAIERSLMGGRHLLTPPDNEDDGSPSPSPVSVSALTAPRSVDDVWSAYLKLSEQLADAVQRIDGLEASR